MVCIEVAYRTQGLPVPDEMRPAESSVKLHGQQSVMLPGELPVPETRQSQSAGRQSAAAEPRLWRVAERASSPVWRPL